MSLKTVSMRLFNYCHSLPWMECLTNGSPTPPAPRGGSSVPYLGTGEAERRPELSRPRGATGSLSPAAREPGRCPPQPTGPPAPSCLLQVWTDCVCLGPAPLLGFFQGSDPFSTAEANLGALDGIKCGDAHREELAPFTPGSSGRPSSHLCQPLVYTCVVLSWATVSGPLPILQAGLNQVECGCPGPWCGAAPRPAS